MSETLPPTMPAGDMSAEQSLRNRADLHKWNMPILAELQDAFAGPLLTLSDRLETVVDACISADQGVETQSDIDTDAAKSLMRWHPIDRLPFSVASLPPNLFDHCDLPHKPFIPTDDYELRKFMESFWPDHLRYGPQIPSLHHPTEPEFMQNLEKELRRRRGQHINQDHWHAYQQVRDNQERRGYTNLSHNASRLLDSIEFPEERGIFGLATDQCEEFLLMDTSSLHRLTSPVRTPIGYYGLSLATLLSRTTGFIIDFIETDLPTRTAIYEHADAHSDVLKKHTLRGKDKRMPGEAHGSFITLAEGVASCLSQLTHLGAGRVEGFEEWQGDELVKDIIDSRAITRSTRLASIGMAGSHALYGTVIPGILEHDGTHAAIPESVRDDLVILARYNVDTYHHPLWAEYHRQVENLSDQVEFTKLPEPPTRLGLLCPMSLPYRFETDTIVPLDEFMKAFRTVFSYVCSLSYEPSIAHRGLPWNIPRLASQRVGPPFNTRRRQIVREIQPHSLPKHYTD